MLFLHSIARTRGFLGASTTLRRTKPDATRVWMTADAIWWWVAATASTPNGPVILSNQCRRRPLWGSPHRTTTAVDSTPRTLANYYYYSCGWRPDNNGEWAGRRSFSVASHSQQHRPLSAVAAALSTTDQAHNNECAVVLPPSSIQILYASQTGTAKLFALQLLEAIEDQLQQESATAAHPNTEIAVTMASLNESLAILSETTATSDFNPAATVEIASANTTTGSSTTSTPWVIFIVSTAGVGQAPDNGQLFYNQLLEKKKQQDHINYSYAMFALGNSLAHPTRYCAFGRDLLDAWQEQYQPSATATAILLPLALGDDGTQKLEDDFDQWQANLLTVLHNSMTMVDDHEKNKNNDSTAMAVVVVGNDGANRVNDGPKVDVVDGVIPAAQSPIPTGTLANASWKPRPKNMYPEIRLQSPMAGESSTASLVPAAISSFYAEGTQEWRVQHHCVLRSDSPNAATNPSALRELQLTPTTKEDDGPLLYETGDHLLVYPRNSDLMVEGYLNIIRDHPDPDGIISSISIQSNCASTNNKRPYPHPTGISLYDTLRHCVDLQAIPSPAVSRWLTGSGGGGATPAEGDSSSYYKTNIVAPRHTLLTLLAESPEPSVSLSDLLFRLPPLQPRYYSIASSHWAHPKTIYLTYRPVKYLTKVGVVREGICTSYLSNIPTMADAAATRDASSVSTTVMAAIRKNPTFRLPVTSSASKPPPIVLVAGGCGVAPIRAFLEQLCWNARMGKDNKRRASYGPVYLFLGFRNPDDAVYFDLVEDANALGILAHHSVTYTSGCEHNALVSDALIEQGRHLYPLLTQDNEKAFTYICGGARTFGVAIQKALKEIFCAQGGHDKASATALLHHMIASGRFHEDLSD